MPRAIWNGRVIAESDRVEIVEGNLYFPPDSLNRAYLQESAHTSVCPWKGTANYFHVAVDGNINENAAWIYRTPKPAASEIKDHVAFWKGIEVER